MTARAEQHRELLSSIDWVEVFVPNDRLRILDLVDTPGLDSVLGEDSANALRFLRKSVQDVRAETLERTARADALLLVFSRSIGGADEDVVTEFSRGVTAATPINTIGVLTKVEDYWPGEPDPMAAGRRVADRLMREPEVRRILFTVQPVASLVGVAAETATARGASRSWPSSPRHRRRCSSSGCAAASSSASGSTTTCRCPRSAARRCSPATAAGD